MLQDQLVVDQAVEHLVAQGRGARGALGGIRDAVRLGQERRGLLLDLARQDDVLTDDGGDLFNQARLGGGSAGRGEDERERGRP